MEHPGQSADQDIAGDTESVRRAAPAFSWKSFSRFVEVYPVATGWLVIWGRYEQQGAIRRLDGQRVYRDLAGVRTRLADAIRQLTGKRELVAEALILFDRHRFPPHHPEPLPEPLERGARTDAADHRHAANHRHPERSEGSRPGGRA